MNTNKFLFSGIDKKEYHKADKPTEGMEHISSIVERVIEGSKVVAVKIVRVCKQCHKEAVMKVNEETFSNGTVHNALYCTLCGGHNNYIAREPSGEEVIWFGKHKGLKFKELPEDYIGWCIENLSRKWARKLYQEAKRRGMNLQGWENFEKGE